MYLGLYVFCCSFITRLICHPRPIILFCPSYPHVTSQTMSPPIITSPTDMWQCDDVTMWQCVSTQWALITSVTDMQLVNSFGGTQMKTAYISMKRDNNSNKTFWKQCMLRFDVVAKNLPLNFICIVSLFTPPAQL